MHLRLGKRGKNGIKKEKNNSIRLWTVALILLLSTFLVRGRNETNALKAVILDSFNQEQQLQMQGIEIKSYKDDSPLFLAIIGWDKDWWEELRIGSSKDGAIKWFEMKDLPDEQSILEAKFLNLKGFDNPIVEVYGETHRGHGALYLYEIKDGQLKLLLRTQAIDFNNDTRWAPDNYEKYGYGNCGEIFAGGRLLSDYEDLNKDGIPDVVLSGTEEIICEKELGEGSSGREGGAGIKVAEIRIKKIFLWNKNENGYFEK